MHKIFTTLIIISILGSICIFPSCAESEINIPTTNNKEKPGPVVIENGEEVIVDIEVRTNGMASYHGSVNVTDFHENGRAEVTYAIYNNTPSAIKPVIEIDGNADIANFEEIYKEGYVKAPWHVYDWVILPETEKINPYDTKYFTVAIEMPEGATIEEDKYAYATMVYYESNRTLIMAVDTWWLIDMKD